MEDEKEEKSRNAMQKEKGVKKGVRDQLNQQENLPRADSWLADDWEVQELLIANDDEEDNTAEAVG